MKSPRKNSTFGFLSPHKIPTLKNQKNYFLPKQLANNMKES